MKLHPRTRPVETAKAELAAFLLDLEQRHQLTYGEQFALLGGVISDLAKYQIRAERHPDAPGKKGDEA